MLMIIIIRFFFLGGDNEIKHITPWNMQKYITIL